MNSLPLVPQRALTVDALYSVHYFEYASGFTFAGESHAFWEMLYVDKGAVTVTAGGVIDTINQLRANHVKVGIVSSASSDLINRALEHFGIEVDVVIGYRQFYEVPNPLLINFAMEKLFVMKENTIYIGCNDNDEKMGRGASIRYFNASWDKAHITFTKGEELDVPNDILTII